MVLVRYALQSAWALREVAEVSEMSMSLEPSSSVRKVLMVDE